MEKWTSLLSGNYDIEHYVTHLTMGEDDGLIIRLSGRDNTIKLDFGNVSAIRFFDEGMVQDILYDDVYINDEKAVSLPCGIYAVQGGEFLRFVNDVSCKMADTLKLKHYIIITQNYNIEVATMWEPDISFEQGES